jgi:TorA maturation chaperone TorD
MSSSTKYNDREKAVARQRIYSFFASIFLLKPEPAKMSNIYSILDMMSDEYDLQRIRYDDFNDNDIEQHFYDCFFVPTSGQYVPPYESVLLEYNSATNQGLGKLNGTAAQHIAFCWAATGFEPEKLCIFEPLRQSCMPDHIGLELAFMSFLCGAEVSALSKEWDHQTLLIAHKWRRYQESFLSEHLCKWIANFAKALAVRSSGFYAQVAIISSAWVHLDAKELNHIIMSEREANG